MNKEFWMRAIERLGMAAVLAAMLVFFYRDQAERWSRLEAANATRWETLFEQNQKIQQDAAETIRACCYDHFVELERLRAQKGAR